MVFSVLTVTDHEFLIPPISVDHPLLISMCHVLELCCDVLHEFGTFLISKYPHSKLKDNIWC